MEDNTGKNSHTEITVIESGPLKVSGNFILKDLQRNNESKPDEVWLCRCGKSKDKPFCDGSHKRE